ncbi:MAG: calcium/sodium antiporter, partial [Lentisphaeria bacterium]|nr:calcium/sodium antiporter [Lentisphaeria bacterium]
RSALQGNADISLGNVVGSNTCNIALILGISAIISPLAVQRQLLKLDVPVMIGAALLLTLFYFYRHGLSRIQGIILLLGFIAYTAWNIYDSGKELKQSAAAQEEKEEKQPSMGFRPALLFVIAGLGLIVGGAELFLISAKFFAKVLKISDAVVGLTLVAVGTSLPELATSVVAACKKEADIAIGNVVGSNIFNILGILGIAPIITPMRNAQLDYVDLGTMLFCSVLLLPLMRTSWKITRKEGALLLGIYCAYITYLFIAHT